MNLFICDHCKNSIQAKCDIFKAFDYNFCTNSCRNKYKSHIYITCPQYEYNYNHDYHDDYHDDYDVGYTTTNKHYGQNKLTSHKSIDNFDNVENGMTINNNINVKNANVKNVKNVTNIMEANLYYKKTQPLHDEYMQNYSNYNVSVCSYLFK